MTRIESVTMCTDVQICYESKYNTVYSKPNKLGKWYYLDHFYLNGITECKLDNECNKIKIQRRVKTPQSTFVFLGCPLGSYFTFPKENGRVAYYLSNDIDKENKKIAEVNSITKATRVMDNVVISSDKPFTIYFKSKEKIFPIKSN